jgi:hypothetical protein
MTKVGIDMSMSLDGFVAGPPFRTTAEGCLRVSQSRLPPARRGAVVLLAA